MRYRIFSKQYSVDSGEYTNNKKKTQILDCNCSYNTIKGSSPYYYYYNREKSCVKFCQDLDSTACDKAPMSIIQAEKSYICIDNSFNNPCGRIILFPYGFYNCESETCSTCNPIPVEDLSRNIVISNLQEATINNLNLNLNTNSDVTQLDQSNNIIISDQSNNITTTISELDQIIASDNVTRDISSEVNSNVVTAYRILPKYTILDFFSMY